MKKKPYTILIPNAASPQNIGDLAILTELLRIIRKKFPNALIIVHSSNPKLHSLGKNVTIKESVSYWALFQDTNIFFRFYRTITAFVAFIVVYLALPIFRKQKMVDIISDFKKADQIIFVGEGYLRSNKGVSQSLNLLVQLAVLFAGTRFGAKKVMASVSIGPFARAWQTALTCLLLKQLDRIIVREKFSLQLLEQYGLKNVLLSTDLALLSKITPEKRTKRPVIGFTIRKWLKKKQQRKLEESYVISLTNLTKKEDIFVKPIVQVHAPFYGDHDARITKRITEKLQGNGVKVLPVTYIQDLQKPTDGYSDLSLLLGMRMHSNIIAATCGVPFVAISYEYKTEGIAEQLGLSDYVIKAEEVTGKALSQLLSIAYTKRHTLRKRMHSSLRAIRKEEEKRVISVL